MAAVSNNDLMEELKSISETFESRITKLQKYFIGRLVAFEKKNNENAAETEILKESLAEMKLKYKNLCEEIALKKHESNNLPNNHLNTPDKNNGDLIEVNATIPSDKTQTLCEDLVTVKKDINVLKQQNLSNDIIATGVPEVKNEILIETINNILTQHDISLQNTDIKRIYRLKNKKSSMIAPILIEFRNVFMKSKIIQSQKINGPVLLSSIDKNVPSDDIRRVYFKDRLTNQNLMLLRECRCFARQNGYQFVWTQDGKNILIKKDASCRPIEIRCVNDLEKLLINK